MSEVRVNNLSNENNTGGPTISGITTYSGRHFFVPPVGDTASRPSDCEPGSLRFNTDIAKLEYYRGDTIGWVEIEASSHEVGGGTGSNTGLGTRGFHAGHHVYGDEIEFITISTLGDSQDFGNLSEARFSMGNLAGSDSRMLFAGGYGYKNTIDFWTVQSTGNASNFGDLTSQRQKMSGCNDKIRAIWAGGTGPGHSEVNIIDYVTIASTGDAVDYGDLGASKNTLASVCSSTRGIWNYDTGPANQMQFTNIRSTGNTIDFGDGYGNRDMFGGQSSSTRGMWAGAYSNDNRIEYITMATLGNTTDFGDLTQGRYQTNSMSSPTRCVFGAGRYYSGGFINTNILDYVEIATTGNAKDFGDMAYMTSEQLSMAGSNGHGGLSG